MPPRLTVDKINHEISGEGYTCLSYDVKTKKFQYECPRQHTGFMRMDHWRRGVRCATCAGNKKLDFSYVKAEIEKEGFELLSDDYKNSGTYLKVKCRNQHTFKITWNNWHTGYRCPYCSGKKKKTLSELTESFADAGYKLLTKTYLSNKQILECVCANGHTYKVSWDNWNSKKARCPKCSNNGVSSQEAELQKFIKNIYDGEIIFNTRDVIKPKELDIYIPDINLAIEYNGLFWHSEKLGKHRTYHLDKLERCLTSGIRLITIFEDEWVSNEAICKSRIFNMVSNGKFNALYARDCTIREIPSVVASNFCKENHLQGYGSGASIRLGAYYEGLLVAVMTFSKPNRSKGSVSKEGIYELHRFCTKRCFRVLGVASKLLSFFENNYEYKELFSYADRRWSVGNLYEQLGFVFSGYTQPNYWYFIDNKARIHRYGLRKQLIKEQTFLTEIEYRKSQGYNIIWDCGNLKYIKTKLRIN